MGAPTEYRAQHEQQVRDLRDAGYTYRAIADKTGLPEATVRGWLKSEPKRRPTDEPAQIVFNAICWFKRNNDGNAPTRDELTQITGYGTGNLHHLLRVLEKRGWIRREGHGNQARKIIVPGGQWLPPERYRETKKIQRATPRSRLRKPQREALRKAGLLCECERGEIKWMKMIQQAKRKPEPMYLCDYCAEDEREMDDQGLMPYQREEQGR